MAKWTPYPVTHVFMVAVSGEGADAPLVSYAYRTPQGPIVEVECTHVVMMPRQRSTVRRHREGAYSTLLDILTLPDAAADLTPDGISLIDKYPALRAVEADPDWRVVARGCNPVKVTDRRVAAQRPCLRLVR